MTDRPAPTGNPAHNEIVWRVMDLSPRWAKPSVWTMPELRQLDIALPVLREFKKEDWMLHRAYMRASIHESQRREFWQPRTRGQWCEQIADVCAHAQYWAQKNNWRKNNKPSHPPPVPKDVSDLDPQEGAAMLREMRLREFK